jgi:lysophospholipase L1-like esterase
VNERVEVVVRDAGKGSSHRKPVTLKGLWPSGDRLYRPRHALGWREARERECARGNCWQLVPNWLRKQQALVLPFIPTQIEQIGGKLFALTTTEATVQTIDESVIRASLRGIAEVEQGSRGLTLHRLPKKYAMYHDVDPLTQKVADQASGAKLAFMTAATKIKLTYRATLDSSADGSYVAPPSSVTATWAGNHVTIKHDNGDRRIWSGSKDSEIRDGDDSVATFELEGDGATRLVEIWLPHNCNIELVELASDGEVKPAPTEKPRWVHYGSSISHAMEADEPTGVWPVVASRELGFELINLGLAGSANIEQFAAQAIAEVEADLVSLKLGINPVNGRNMTMRTFVPAVHSFIDVVRSAHPKTPVLVISPIFCEGHEQNPGPTSAGPDGKAIGVDLVEHDWVQDLTLERIREALESIVERRNDPNLHYLSGLELFSEADAHMMPDGLHPNADGYRLIGERFANLVSRNNFRELSV